MQILTTNWYGYSGPKNWHKTLVSGSRNCSKLSVFGKKRLDPRDWCYGSVSGSRNWHKTSVSGNRNWKTTTRLWFLQHVYLTQNIVTFRIETSILLITTKSLIFFLVLLFPCTRLPPTPVNQFLQIFQGQIHSKEEDEHPNNNLENDETVVAKVDLTYP